MVIYSVNKVQSYVWMMLKPKRRSLRFPTFHLAPPDAIEIRLSKLRARGEKWETLSDLNTSIKKFDLSPRTFLLASVSAICRLIQVAINPFMLSVSDFDDQSLNGNFFCLPFKMLQTRIQSLISSPTHYRLFLAAKFSRFKPQLWQSMLWCVECVSGRLITNILDWIIPRIIDKQKLPLRHKSRKWRKNNSLNLNRGKQTNCVVF